MKILLTDEEITRAYYNAWNEDKCHKLGREAVAKAQLKKVVVAITPELISCGDNFLVSKETWEVLRKEAE